MLNGGEAAKGGPAIYTHFRGVGPRFAAGEQLRLLFRVYTETEGREGAVETGVHKSGGNAGSSPMPSGD